MKPIRICSVFWFSKAVQWSHCKIPAPCRISRSRCLLQCPLPKDAGALIFQSSISDQTGTGAHPPHAQGPRAGRDVLTGPGGPQACPAPGAALGPWSVPGPPSRAAAGPALPPPGRPAGGRSVPAGAPERRSQPAPRGQRAPADAGLRLPAGNAVALRGGTRRSAGSFEGRGGKRLWRGSSGGSRGCRAARCGPRRQRPGGGGSRRAPLLGSARAGLPAAPGKGSAPSGAARWRTPGGQSSEVPLWHSPPAARGRLTPGSGPGAAPLSCRPALGSSLLLAFSLAAPAKLRRGRSPFWLRQGGCRQSGARLPWHCWHPSAGRCPSSTSSGELVREQWRPRIADQRATVS